MIVKNEAEHLSRCLESVRDAVDEIIVVDTGSTDDTVAVARRFGALVVDFPWQDDFALARNIGLERAKGDWILWLDADEELEASDKEKFRRNARSEEREGIFFQLLNHVGDRAPGAVIDPVMRMIRNRPEYRFEGRVHEQITNSIYRLNPDAVFHFTDVRIHHYGYRPEIVMKKNKVERNVVLLQQMLADNPDNPFTLYNLGVEHLRMAEPERALEAFRKARALQKVTNSSYAHLIYKWEIRSLFLLERVDEAVQIADEGISQFPKYTDLHQMKGIALLETGKFEEARVVLQQAAELGPAPIVFHTEEGMGTFQTCYALGLAHEKLQHYDQAADWFIRAVHCNSSFGPPLYRLFRMMKVLGREARIYAFVKERFQLEPEGSVANLIHILFETDCLEPVRPLLRLLKSPDSQIFKSFSKYKYYLLKGNCSAARNTLRQSRTAEKKTWEAILNSVESGDFQHIAHLFSEPDGNGEYLELFVKALFYNGRHEEVLRMIAWLLKNTTNTARTSIRAIRALTSFADAHLEKLNAAFEYQDAVLQARLDAPYADGLG